jgi:hypothetical protein
VAKSFFMNMNRKEGLAGKGIPEGIMKQIMSKQAKGKPESAEAVENTLCRVALPVLQYFPPRQVKHGQVIPKEKPNSLAKRSEGD